MNKSNPTNPTRDKGTASRRARGLIRRVYITEASQQRLQHLAGRLGLPVYEALDRAVCLCLALCEEAKDQQAGR